jgi:hypothetical protein
MDGNFDYCQIMFNGEAEAEVEITTWYKGDVDRRLQ